MADENKPVTPAAEAAPVTPASTTPAAAAPAEEPRLSAADALGLSESPRESLKKIDAVQAPTTGTPKPPEKPAAVTPPVAAPAVPATEKPAAVTPPVAAPVAEKPKIKIGGKEYTEEELAALVEKKEPAPVAPVAPAAPAAPAQEPPKPPTPEEIQASEKEFTDRVAATIPILATEAEIEAVLVGGAEGAKALTSVLQNVAARSILEARKSIYDELNPIIDRFEKQFQPLLQNDFELRKATVQNAFLTKHTHFAEPDDAAFASTVAMQLLKTYPQDVAKMSVDEFVDEVERQASALRDKEFKRWNPTYQGTWADWRKAQKTTPAATPAAPAAVPAATTPAATPAATVVAPAAPVAPAAVPRPPAPAGNSPALTARSGAYRPEAAEQKAIASSLTS